MGEQMAAFLQEQREEQFMPYVPLGQTEEQSEPCNHDHTSVTGSNTHTLSLFKIR